MASLARLDTGNRSAPVNDRHTITSDEAWAAFERRTLSLRAFDDAGMLKEGVLAMPGEADARIRALFGREEIATIHAHNAAYGCFLARIERN